MRSALRKRVGAVFVLVLVFGPASYFEALNPQRWSIATFEVVSPAKEGKGDRFDDGRVATSWWRPIRLFDSAMEEAQKQFARLVSDDISKHTSTNTAGAPGNQSIANKTSADRLNETLSTIITTTTINDPHVISWIGVSALDSMIGRYWKGNLFCEEIQAARQQHNNSQLHIAVNMTFGCQELYSTSQLGSGNFISVFYHMRMSALALGNVDIHVTCPDAEQVKTQLVLPWFMGHFWGSEQLSLWPAENSSEWSVEATCGNYDTSPISHMYQRIQYAVRRMAIGLVGVPVHDPSHPAHKWADEYLWSPYSSRHVPDSDLQLPLPQKDDNPPWPAESLELDDATIHFRCGGASVFFCSVILTFVRGVNRAPSKILRVISPLSSLRFAFVLRSHDAESSQLWFHEIQRLHQIYFTGRTIHWNFDATIQRRGTGSLARSGRCQARALSHCCHFFGRVHSRALSQYPCHHPQWT